MFILKAFLIGGTALFGVASFAVGKTFSSAPKEILVSDTVDQIRAQMERFKSSLKNGDVVTVGNFPMPGETMLWLTPKDGGHWKARFNLVQKSKHVNVKSDLELRKWCQIQKAVTKVHIVKKSGKDFQIKMSVDSKTTHPHLIKATDLHDLKTYCSRPITNKEWFGKAFKNSTFIEVKRLPVLGQIKTCSYWTTQPYSKNNEEKLAVCFRFGAAGKEIVDYGDE